MLFLKIKGMRAEMFEDYKKTSLCLCVSIFKKEKGRVREETLS